jgi:hypothetical protein
MQAPRMAVGAIGFRAKAKFFVLVASLAAAPFGSTASLAQQPPPQSPNMTFFITSSGPGKGADLGGLEGADRQCQTLAQAAGAGNKTWRAYLSTQATGGAGAVNARDRIGRGPWQNFKGEVVAQNVDDLHSDNNKLGMQVSLTERGTVVAGVGYTPNAHDVLTGSQMDGRAFPPGEDRTCATGRAAPKARPWSATATARVCATMPRPSRGIRRIPRAGPTAAAARTT